MAELKLHEAALGECDKRVHAMQPVESEDRLRLELTDDYNRIYNFTLEYAGSVNTITDILPLKERLEAIRVRLKLPSDHVLGTMTLSWEELENLWKMFAK